MKQNRIQGLTISEILTVIAILAIFILIVAGAADKEARYVETLTIDGHQVEHYRQGLHDIYVSDKPATTDNNLQGKVNQSDINLEQ